MRRRDILAYQVQHCRAENSESRRALKRVKRTRECKEKMKSHVINLREKRLTAWQTNAKATGIVWKTEFLLSSHEKHMAERLVRNCKTIFLQNSLDFLQIGEKSCGNFQSFQSPSRFSPLQSSCRNLHHIFWPFYPLSK